MQHKQTIISEIDFTKTLRMLTQAYEEISVMKMQRIRDSVLKTRTFLEKLAEVYHDVKNSYKNQLDSLMKKKKIKDPSQFMTFKKNGKTVSVFLSANAKLHGDIIFKVFRVFMDDVGKGNTDIIIVGKVGKELFERVSTRKDYMYFEIPDMDVTTEDLKPVVFHLVNYQTVNVYYGRFESFFSQDPQKTNVTGDRPLQAQETQENPAVKHHRYLFEPSLEKILNFFETQMFTSFFKQTLTESQLARFASRIKAMEDAIQNIDTRIKHLYIEGRRVNKLLDNKRQVERISGISLWSE